MWVLDVISACDEPQEHRHQSFYLIAGEWSIGRKRCHFNFNSDASISRSHALLHVGALSVEQLQDPQSRPFLKVVDQNSRFGTFVNQDQVLGEKALQHGDEITFGAKRTVLRVRYQSFLLVASRILKPNRSRVNDACQRLGMHLIQKENKDATHCIMDPGKIVATIKVLWALVYNQQVVCTPWLFEILQRKCLADALPKCDQFLPQDDNLPSVANNYLPNPLRKSLFRQHVVVFLVPGNMEELIVAMGGEQILAYKLREDQEMLVCLEQAAYSSRHVMVVEPNMPSNSSSNNSNSATEDGAGSCSDNNTVQRRVQLLRELQAPFVTIQELAASVIFVKTPALKSTICLGHHGSSSGYSSSSALTEQKTSCALVEETASGPPEETATATTAATTRTMPGTQQELVRSISRPASMIDSVKERESPVRTPQERVTVKAEPTSLLEAGHSSMRLEEPLAVKSENESMNHRVRVPPHDPLDEHKVLTSTSSIMPGSTPNVDETGWVSTSRRFKSMPQIPQELGEPTPIVMSASLVVKRESPPSNPPADSISAASTTSQLVNYKRFKKGNLPPSRNKSWSLFPIQTVATSVDNDARSSMQCSMQAVEEQERIADELFAIAERRAARRKL